MTRETTSIKQRNGRYVQGGETDYHPITINIGTSSERLGWWEKRNIERSYDDVSFVVSKGAEGRPDLLSYQAYGSAEYAWFIMQYNSIVDPIQELYRGRRITVPTMSRLKIYIMNRPFRYIGNS